ncbi:MAG: hypothetical protein H6700_06625 [Myxococcales bacterium]|nr:hypothetical protein [Myxococcales bacterium]
MTLAFAALGAVGCGASDEAGASGDYYEPGGSDASYYDAGSGGGAYDDASSPDDDVFVPEAPEELPPPAPAATSRYVYTLSEGLDAVVRIDVDSLAVLPIAVGRAPSAVVAIPGSESVAVLNAGSGTVSLVEDAVTAEIEVGWGSNRLVASADGAYLAVWYDNAHARRGDAVGALEEVTVIRVESAAAFTVTVGLNVREVAFAGGRVYAATDEDLYAADLSTLSRDVAADAIALPGEVEYRETDSEFVFDAAGDVAVLRTDGLSGVYVMDLRTVRGQVVALDEVPTDVDILSDGARAVVTMRRARTFAVIDLRAALAGDADAVRLEPVEGAVGSTTPTSDAASAMSFSSLSDDASLTVVSVADGESRQIPLQLAPESIHVGSLSQRVVVGHGVADVAPWFGATVIDLESDYAKLVVPSGAVDSVVFTPDGHDAFATLETTAGAPLSVVTWFDLDTFAARDVTLGGGAESLGVTPSGLAYVTQDVPGGRITLIDPATGAVRHVSAFALNAFVD